MSAKIFNFPARRHGKFSIGADYIKWWFGRNRKQTIAYATTNPQFAFAAIQRLFPHLILKKFEGYVSIKFPACEK